MGRTNLATTGQVTPLPDAEPVLLVHNCQTKSVKDNAFLDKCLRADQDIQLSVEQPGQRFRAIPLFRAACQESNVRLLMGSRSDYGVQGGKELTGQDFSGGHDCGLISG